MKLEELVNTYYDILSYNEKLVIDYILNHQEEVSTSTSEEVARQCGVTRPTLLRTLKKLTVEGYSELKYLLQQNSIKEIDTIANDTIYTHYLQMIEDIFSKDYQEVCKVLYTARHIYVYGTGNEQKSIAEEFKRMMFSLGKGVVDFYDQGEVEFQKNVFSKEDIFIVISMSGETSKAIDILKTIKHTGIVLLSITRLKNNTIARMCGYNLYVGTKTISLDQKDGYEIMTSFYVLLDGLFVAYLQYIKELII